MDNFSHFQNYCTSRALSKLKNRKLKKRINNKRRSLPELDLKSLSNKDEETLPDPPQMEETEQNDSENDYQLEDISSPITNVSKKVENNAIKVFQKLIDKIHQSPASEELKNTIMQIVKKYRNSNLFFIQNQRKNFHFIRAEVINEYKNIQQTSVHMIGCKSLNDNDSPLKDELFLIYMPFEIKPVTENSIVIIYPTWKLYNLTKGIVVEGKLYKIIILGAFNIRFETN